MKFTHEISVKVQKFPECIHLDKKHKYSKKLNHFSPNQHTAYSYRLESMADVVYNPEFDKTLPTVIYIHGYLGKGDFDESLMAVRGAYRDSNNQNFIAIDWSAFSSFTSSNFIHYEELKLVNI